MTSSQFHDHKVQQRKEHLPFDVESWYDWLGAGHTFATHFVEVSLAEAQALLRWYHHRYNSRDAPASEQVRALVELRDRLTPILDEAGKDWFIRLSSRSPKDAGFLDKSMFEEELERWRKVMQEDAEHLNARRSQADQRSEEADGTYHHPPDMDREKADKLLEANAQMLAFSQITWENQKTKGGPATSGAVLEHLVSSERVLVDLVEATEAEELFSMKIIARQWEPTLRHDFEFRGFVNNGQLNALSQYNHYCYFPHVLREKAALEKSIVKYWQTEIKPRIPLDSYVVDFAVLSDGRVTVVELNPFKTTTGACLFSWSHHREILESRPFEFRIHEDIVPQLPNYVEHALPEAFRQSAKDESLASLSDLQRLYAGESQTSSPPRCSIQ
ncbi:uncharacterized protein LOC135829724 [Sycon ciliatum]|uniref:uncharacterized protein LOC135829724 n=1 Tax=Sycon ciliatum TaxID=27933 RepID=UPI0031F718CD